MKTLVFITSRFPFPLNKGDKLRVYWQLKSLKKHANIHLISISEKKVTKEQYQEIAPFCTSINNFVLPKFKRYKNMLQGVFSKSPFSVNYFYDSTVKSQIAKLIEKIKPDVVHAHLIRTSLYVEDLKNVRKSIDFMDCFSLGAQKEMQNTKHFFRKTFLKIEYKRLSAFEKKATQIYEKQYIISKQDYEAMPDNNSSKIMVLPNGVDFSTFYPRKDLKKYDLLFSGHMGYVPNIYAAKYAVSEIIPLLSETNKLLIAGIGITKNLWKLQSKQVILQEHFPHIREAFWQSKILLAPMKISIGLQNKILQAMAMKVLVICSPEANAAIHAPVGEVLLTASSPEEYASSIQRVLSDSKLYSTLVENAYDYVSRKYDWNDINAEFVKTLLD